MPHIKQSGHEDYANNRTSTNYLLDILTNSPNYLSGKCIGAVNENSNFDIEVHKRHNANFILGTP